MPFQAFVIREASQDVESPAKDVQPQMCGLEGMERAPNCLRIKGQTHLRPRHRLTVAECPLQLFSPPASARSPFPRTEACI
mmetsp:Transcript_11431/g.15681  ORF Transcript_11431/g.15681 Transcript_11431/m.15681 type:complete len:81 (-) Transcript_11431:11-253(-)